MTKNGMIKVIYTKEEFNKIVELVGTTSEIHNENVEKDADSLAYKLTKYSSIIDGNVQLNLFAKEAAFLIQILSNSLETIEIKKDWYDVLSANRESFKREKESEKNA